MASLRWTEEQDSLVFRELAANVDSTKTLAQVLEDAHKKLTKRSITGVNIRWSRNLSTRFHLTELDNDVKCKMVSRYNIRLSKQQEEYFKALGVNFHENGEEEGSAEDEIQQNTSSRTLSAERRQANQDKTQTLREQNNAARVAQQKQEVAPMKTSRGKPTKNLTVQGQESHNNEEVATVDLLPLQLNTEPFFNTLKELIRATTETALEKVIQQVNADPVRRTTSSGSTTNLKEFFEQMKKMIARINSPALKDIEDRVDSALLALNRKDQHVPVDTIKSMFNVILLMVNK